MKLCKSLRWKGYYDASWPDRETLLLAHLRNDVPYTCLKTCQSVGPDGDLAAIELCSDVRPCFERSPKDPGRAGTVG